MGERNELKHKTPDEIQRDNILHSTALVLLGRIKLEDMATEYRTIIEGSLKLMFEDGDYERKVKSIMNNIALSSRAKRTELFSKEDLKNAKKHTRRRRRHNIEVGVCNQPRLFTVNGDSESAINSNDSADFEWGIGKLHGSEKRCRDLIAIDTKNIRDSLRVAIGLPVARDKDPFYRALVNVVIKQDIFEVFSRGDRELSTGTMSVEYSNHLEWVKRKISEILDPNISVSKRYKMLKDTVTEFKESNKPQQ